MSARGAICFSMMLLIVAALTLGPGSPAKATTVSLGDSYSSGEGVGEYDAGTKWKGGNGCHRSPSAWPRLLGVSAENHFACSGAETKNLLFESQKDGPRAGADAIPQIVRLKALAKSEDLSKVYVGIGGNDLGFSGIIRSCVLPTLGGCLSKLESKEFPRLENVILPNLTLTLAAARIESGGADVILVGYPNIVPAKGKLKGCGIWMSQRERARLLRIQDRLGETMGRAAQAAGVSFVSVSDALKGHELCTKDSWVRPITVKSLFGKDRFSEQGHPNQRGQEAMAKAVTRDASAGAGIVPSPPPGCVPATDISAIIDDSKSMEDNDPYNLRSSATQLLITKPNGQLRTLGAIEFGTDAGQLFSPSLVAFSKAAMLAALANLRADGVDDQSDTDYNDAFAASSFAQPSASARIFFTDGEHNQGEYLDGHLGGPRTYVVGLGIGPGGEGDSDADLLRRIATETGGHYFPLLRYEGESIEGQTERIQPVFNAIDALLQCRAAPDQFTRKLTSPKKLSSVISSPFIGSEALEVVISWADPSARIQLGSASVTGAGGHVIASLSGRTARRGRHRGTKRRTREVRRLETAEVGGIAYTTVKVPRPPKGSRLNVTVKATTLPASTDVSVQIGPVAEEPPAPPFPPSPPADPNPQPPSANIAEQVTPNHPVNTFANYHNASGMGPPIPAGTWVEVSCRVHDPFIVSVNPDGWWYRITSPPWSDNYYSPANVFMNGDPYGGPYTHNTNFSIPVC